MLAHACSRRLRELLVPSRSSVLLASSNRGWQVACRALGYGCCATTHYSPLSPPARQSLLESIATIALDLVSLKMVKQRHTVNSLQPMSSHGPRRTWTEPLARSPSACTCPDRLYSALPKKAMNGGEGGGCGRSALIRRGRVGAGRGRRGCGQPSSVPRHCWTGGPDGPGVLAEL